MVFSITSSSGAVPGMSRYRSDMLRMGEGLDSNTSGKGESIMKILVCVKQVPDTTEIRIDPVKNTLIRGCRRDSGVAYPNREFGFGKLDVYRSFENLR
jgi:hypothetical protein